jgi:hypothetical protein
VCYGYILFRRLYPITDFKLTGDVGVHPTIRCHVLTVSLC